MRVTRLSLRDFRGYADADVLLGDGMTVAYGSNGVGKTNLLEALYFGCTGRSFRTANDRELVRFQQRTARVEVTALGDDGAHVFSVGLEPGVAKRMRADGQTVDRVADLSNRPLVSVFAPDRLEIVKGPPAVRRGHLDQVVTALWPARAATRRAYGAALAQRNALLARVRRGLAAPAALKPWDAQLASHGLELMADRARAVEVLQAAFAERAAELGLAGEAQLGYKPRSSASTATAFADELLARLEQDLERGFTGHGPHRDELALLVRGRETRVYASQGEQRLTLLALLLAEREAIGRLRPAPPLLLLDDVMSELDAERRARLVALLRDGGQSVVTTTELEHVPGADGADVTRVAVAELAGALEAAAA